MIQHYLTSSEAVQYVEQKIKQPVKYYDLDNLIRAHAIPEPDMIAGRRMWSKKLLDQACSAIRIRRLKRPSLLKKKLGQID